mmetsp:Transcript_13001/g.30249  ORF Transcript_13001/g.30249 Transcript_13001/m.30249 type:complete len:87 (+) Transcript_13001:567-827(+)
MGTKMERNFEGSREQLLIRPRLIGGREYLSSSKLPAICNDNGYSGLTLVAAYLLYGRDNVHTRFHLSKDNMLSVKPACGSRAKKKL